MDWRHNRLSADSGVSSAGSGPFRRLDRYISRLIVVPLLSVIAITIALMILQYLPILFDRLVQQGASAYVVWKMLALLVPEYLDLALPIGLLIGIVLAFRRLARNHEMDAIAASGVSSLRLLCVPLVYAAGVAVLTVGMTGFVQPLGARAYDELQFVARAGGFGTPLEVDSFNEIADGLALRMDSRDSASGTLKGVFLSSAVAGKRPFVLTARDGKFVKAPLSRRILLRLHDCRIVMETPQFRDRQAMSFDQYDVPLPEASAASFRPSGTDEQEMTLPELLHASGGHAARGESRHRMHGELQRRLILSIVPLLLPFLAFATYNPPVRSDSAIGPAAGLFLLVLLIKGLDFGVHFTQWPASPIQWAAFLLFSAMVLRLYYIAAYKVGGEPLSLVYRVRDRFRREASI